MKKLITVFLCMMLFASIQAQENLRKLDLNLENYEYPYPVNFLEIEAQQATYTMAYMYVQARVPNGKTVTLLHGKNFNGAYWETTITELTEAGFNGVAYFSRQQGICNFLIFFNQGTPGSKP